MSNDDRANDIADAAQLEDQIRSEVREQLTGPGGPFEITEEEVLGEHMPVFKTRKGSLREMLQQSTLHGDKEYMVYEDQRISYAEHYKKVTALARALEDRYGIRKGDRVAILAANCPEWVMTFWAVTSLGAIVSALNGWWTADEIKYGVEQSEPKLIVGDRKRLSRVDGADLGVPVVEIEKDIPALLEEFAGAELSTVEIAEDDPALLLFTSGTTGRPKGAVVSHRALVGFVQVNTLQGLERIVINSKLPDAPAPDAAPPSPCALVTAPLFHLSGLYAAAIMMLATGSKTVYRSGRFDPGDVLRLIERERVTIWSALGSMGPQVVQHPDVDKFDLSSMRNIGFGGAPTSPALQEKMKHAFPSASGNHGMGYGLSETGGLGAGIGGRELMRRPTSTGKASVTVDLQIRDDAGNPVPEGEFGEIHMRSGYLMLEYWRNPEATNKTILPGRWLATGDVGRLEDGYLYIDSRARDMILRAAENIYPVEIEHRLDAHPGVAESAVVGVDHDVLGQEVKAIVVPAQGAALDSDTLASWVAESVSAFKVPSLWEIREEPLPRNASGKVLKNVLTGEASVQLIED